MIIPEVAPMLTCTQINDGFLYEVQIRAVEGQEAITKIRIGPYFFRPEHRPKKILGIITGGPESGFLLHKSTPLGWSRFNWEVLEDEPGHPTYITSRGTLNPGTQGIFRFVSLFRPWGLRVGLQLFRGDRHTDCGVSGPNYEPFVVGDHDH